MSLLKRRSLPWSLLPCRRAHRAVRATSTCSTELNLQSTTPLAYVWVCSCTSFSFVWSQLGLALLTPDRIWPKFFRFLRRYRLAPFLKVCSAGLAYLPVLPTPKYRYLGWTHHTIQFEKQFWKTNILILISLWLLCSYFILLSYSSVYRIITSFLLSHDCTSNRKIRWELESLTHKALFSLDSGSDTLQLLLSGHASTAFHLYCAIH